MMFLSKKAFTLVELMIVIAIIGILAASLVPIIGPYIDRSRDVRRFTDITQYGRIVDTYFKDHDVVPSTKGSGGALTVDGFCADEVFTKRINYTGDAFQFAELNQLMSSIPLKDPIDTTPAIAPCGQTGSYLYSSFKIRDDQYSLLGSHMAIRANGNYSTGSDISSTGSVSSENAQLMTSSYKGTISDTTVGDIYYLVATKH